MSGFSIKDFWNTRLSKAAHSPSKFIKGWSYIEEDLHTFTEAPLSQSSELDFGGDPNPNTVPIVIVSAPGAVGKTTLARQIAFVTGAVYVDLAASDPVGGNTISGGLVKSGLYQSWSNGTTALLIDGLDEARLRVTQEAFEAFLDDILTLSTNRQEPIVLFGRTGAALDTWLFLSSCGAETAVLEIGYYGPEEAVGFAEAVLNFNTPNRPHQVVERKLLELLLARLRDQTETNGDRFAGYAPVLQAVAKRIKETSNPRALLSEIENGAQPVTLQNVISAILERERGKLQSINFDDPGLKDKLYSHSEQLERIAARMFGLPAPQVMPMGSNDLDTYTNALETWVPDHPFLDGSGDPSSVVFDAAISSWALKQTQTADAALKRELGRGVAANPFLSEFYIGEEDNSQISLPSQHIGILYASFRARLSLGDTASLLVEGAEDGDDEEALRAEVEITLSRRGEDRSRILEFETEQIGPIFLGAHVEDVDICVPLSRVEVGPGAESILVAPVNIQCSDLAITTNKIIVENPSGRETAAVFLEAEAFDGASISSAPIVRGDVSFAASWPDVRSHPWTNYATSPQTREDPRVEEALRRLRKFVISFRSHSRGALARFKAKIEHARMTKGTGRAVLDHMVSQGILSLDGTMYFLDPNALSDKVGISYKDCMARDFSDKAVDFVREALND